MSPITLKVTLGVFAALLVHPTEAASANHDSPRQYYSGWQKHPTRGYHYRRLYYKPTPRHVGYKHHYVLFYPSKPQHTYFYNPYKGAYWGRCAIVHEGRYSLLPPEQRRPSLTDIPAAAFPPPASPPRLPGAPDGILLDLPPDDLPIGIPG